jgi:hypothetical protein
MKATWDDSTPRAHEALAPNPFEAMALLLEDEGQLGAGLIVLINVAVQISSRSAHVWGAPVERSQERKRATRQAMVFVRRA